MNELDIKIASLYIGSPPPHPAMYAYNPIIELLFGDITIEEFKKENERRKKLYDKEWVKYKIQRRKELDELEKIL